MSRKSLSYLALALVGLFVAGTAVWLSVFGSTKDYSSCGGVAVAGGGDLGGPFELLNSGGETVTDKDVITKPSLIYFGYTFCPDVCPLDVDRNAQSIEILEQRGKIVTPVFISIDPNRDTPQVVGEFADVMHPRMIGLTGSEEQVKAASTSYRTYYKSHRKDDADQDYLVDHSTFSYLVLPQVGFVDYFKRELTPDQMADRIECFLDKS